MRIGWDYSREYGPCHQRLYLPEGSLRVTVENYWHITMYPWGEKLILKMVSKSPSFSADLGTFWRTSSLGYHISQGVLVHFYCKERLTWAKYFLTLQLSHPRSHTLWNGCTALGLHSWVHLPPPKLFPQPQEQGFWQPNLYWTSHSSPPR